MKEIFEKIKNGIQVKKDYFQRFYECEGKTKHDADLNKATQLAFDDAIKVVDRVAEEYSVSEKNAHTDGWIPCSERLPEENKRYITTSDVCGDGEIETFDLYFDDGVWFVDKGCEAFLGTVIAWQPLPEPYQPKGE